jgi:hypothetical protein
MPSGSDTPTLAAQISFCECLESRLTIIVQLAMIASGFSPQLGTLMFALTAPAVAVRPVARACGGASPAWGRSRLQQSANIELKVVQHSIFGWTGITQTRHFSLVRG